jgi:hypothetical protein
MARGWIHRSRQLSAASLVVFDEARSSGTTQDGKPEPGTLRRCLPL